MQALTVKTQQEREAADIYQRAVKDRAHREVDRVREETKAGARQLKAMMLQLEQLQRRLEVKQDELSQAQLVAAMQQVRADTLDAQLRLRNKATATKSNTRKNRSRDGLR